MYIYSQDVLTTLCFSSQKPIVHPSVLTSQVRNQLYPLQWNALPYIGKFDSQAAFGIFGLAATCRHNNTNQTLQPVALNINTAHTHCAMQLRMLFCYGQSAFAANLRLRPLYGCGQSTVTANLWLQPIYSCSQSMVVATVFCYYGLSAH